MPHKELEELLLANGIEAPLATRLAQFGALVLLGNKRCNLTAARTPEAILPHILDSLTFITDVKESLVDIGSGGGFPAIPIALATDVPVTMIESVGKKAKFLKTVLDEMQLVGTVLSGRAEDFALEDAYRAQYHCATARAVAITPAVIEYTVPFLHKGGVALLQRGQLDEKERQASADAALVLGGELLEERLFDGNKRLLVIKKTRETPWRFPRKNGIPLKKPLCLS